MAEANDDDDHHHYERAFFTVAPPLYWHCLRRISLCDTADMNALPVGFWKSVPRIQELDLSGCDDLETLPECTEDDDLPTHLRILNVEDCWSLKRLPAFLGRLVHLRELNIRSAGGSRASVPAAASLRPLLRVLIHIKRQLDDETTREYRTINLRNWLLWDGKASNARRQRFSMDAQTYQRTILKASLTPKASLAPVKKRPKGGGPRTIFQCLSGVDGDHLGFEAKQDFLCRLAAYVGVCTQRELDAWVAEQGLWDQAKKSL